MMQGNNRLEAHCNELLGGTQNHLSEEQWGQCCSIFNANSFPFKFSAAALRFISSGHVFDGGASIVKRKILGVLVSTFVSAQIADAQTVVTCLQIEESSGARESVQMVLSGSFEKG